MIGLIGKKVGMTRIFNPDGMSIPITVIQIEVNHITQVKNLNKDGYCAIQLTTGSKKKSRIKKPEAGHFSKAGVQVGRGLWEFRVIQSEKFSIGQSISIKQLTDVSKVDITGISKGKGFSGTIKRWNFSTQDATHGNSLSHRVPGSIGQNQSPGRVFRGKKMAGQMGKTRVTIQNLNVIRIDLENNLLLIKGSVPGANGADLIVKPAVKQQRK